MCHTNEYNSQQSRSTTFSTSPSFAPPYRKKRILFSLKSLCWNWVQISAFGQTSSRLSVTRLISEYPEIAKNHAITSPNREGSKQEGDVRNLKGDNRLQNHLLETILSSVSKTKKTTIEHIRPPLIFCQSKSRLMCFTASAAFISTSDFALITVSVYANTRRN